MGALIRLIFLQIILLFLSITFVSSQDVQWSTRAPMPEPVTNNAVTSIEIDGKLYLYSFGGIGTSKACGAAHTKSFKYDYAENSWSQIENVPEPIGGFVAAGASTVGDKIILVGGYHITDNCNEVTSSSIHIFDPKSDTFESRRELDVPIDDQVQGVYDDRYVYIITGWSTSTNVRNVQIYDVQEDTLLAGTSVPSSSMSRVFGASGVIIGQEIYYMGGAGPLCTSTTNCFKPVASLQIGTIDPEDPTDITWKRLSDDNAVGYRTTAADYLGSPIWLGGSDITYNFDGIDYNGTGGVSPSEKVTFVSSTGLDVVPNPNSFPPIMDHRGHGRVDEVTFLIAGGMDANQQVSDQLYEVKINSLLTHAAEVSDEDIFISPNPVKDEIKVKLNPNHFGSLEIYDIQGRRIEGLAIASSLGQMNVDVSGLSLGIYFIVFRNEQGEVFYSSKILKL